MKLTMCLLLAVSATALAEEAKKKEATSKSEPAAKAETQIPAGATEVNPGVFRHVDKDGKAWLYRYSPFGLLKTAEPTDSATKKDQATDAVDDGMTAVEEGGQIRFTRKGPFGRNEWTRKKSELTAVEREVWERQQSRKAPAK